MTALARSGTTKTRTGRRAAIAQSWDRCTESGLDPGLEPGDGFAVAETDPAGRLVVAAGPVLDAMERDLADTPVAAILTDAQARVTAMRFGRRDLRGLFEAAGAVHGREFAESTTGTNAIATVHTTREGLVVEAGDHYLESLRRFSCYGHPIVHPLTGELTGVLDVTGPAGENPAMLAPFVRRVVREIEEALVETGGAGARGLLAAFRAAAGSGPVIALGHDLVLANRTATDLLDAAEHELLRDLVAGSWSLTDGLVELSGGRTRVGRDAVVGGGAVLHLRPCADAPPDRARWSRTLRLPSPRTGLADAVVVAGEPGTGRTTAMRATLGDDPVTVLEAADLTPATEHSWLAVASRSIGTPGEVTVVEDVHLLLASTASRLRRLLAGPHTRVVLTSCPVEDLTGEVAALAADCGRREEIRPLRTRTDEIPALVGTMLAGLGAADSVRFTTEALDLLATHRWPGNLRELAGVVAETAARRSAGDLTVRDLPEAYRRPPVTGESAGELARAEREAIEAALRVCDGNKLRAARRLGISRSTLYARLRALHITL
ncbi:MAG TPA: helix-turn-helix domain-containing protein [Actinomycetospora sp.]|uniref:sigma-54-dependent Fis family transcriptional regulator n=1 Tax=Actinomycetospora sp. TaxID=1872135 RepID=UPI002F3E7B72